MITVFYKLKIFSLAVLLTQALVTWTWANFTLGSAQYATTGIVIPTGTSNNAKLANFAAQELQKHLQLITGQIFPISTSTAGLTRIFYVGIRPDSDTNVYEADEGRYKIATTSVHFYGHDEIKLSSDDVETMVLDRWYNNFNRTGTLHTVYDFLERELGVRWVEPGDVGIVYIAQPNINLVERTQSWISAYTFQRNIRTVYNTGRLQSRINDIPPDFRLTSNQETAARRVTERWLKRQRMGNRGAFIQLFHAFADWYAPVSEGGKGYGTTNPEWFALNANGVRGPMVATEPDRVKMCVSEPTLITKIVNDFIAGFTMNNGVPIPTHPSHQFLDASENDAGSGGIGEYDHSPATVALDALLPGEVFGDHLTDRYVHFANNLQNELRSRPGFANFSVAMQAYNETSWAPPRNVSLNPGIMFQFVPDMADPEQSLIDTYTGWQAKGAPATWVYRPNDLNVDIGLPLGQDRLAFAAQQLGYSYGGRGMDHDSMYDFWSTGVGLTYYALAKHHQDPSRDFNYWESDFTAQYGAAAADVKSYLAVFRTVFDNTILPEDRSLRTKRGPAFLRWGRLGGIMSRYTTFFPTAKLNEAKTFLDTAAGRSLSSSERARLDRLRLGHEHTVLTHQLLEALNGTDVIAPLRAAEALLSFRRTNKNNLTINWAGLFAYQSEATGLSTYALAKTFTDLGGEGLTATDLNVNGGFNNTNGGWTLSAYQDGNVSVPAGSSSYDSTVKIEGSHSFRVAKPSSSSFTGVYSVNQELSGLEAGKSYAFSYKWRRELEDYPTRPETLDYPRLRFIYCDANGAPTTLNGQSSSWYAPNSTDLDPGWRSQIVSFTVPADSAVRRIYVSLFLASEGVSWADDFHLFRFNPAPATVITPPTSITVAPGTSASLLVSASGQPPLSYQWRKDGVAVTGQTSAILSFASASWDDYGVYDCIVSNTSSSATSAAATLNVYQPPHAGYTAIADVPVNGGLDNVLSPWSVSAWQNNASATVPSGSYVFDNIKRVAGSHALRITNNDAAFTGQIMLNQNILNIEPGKTYGLSVRWRRELSSAPVHTDSLSHPKMRIIYRDDSNQAITHNGSTSVIVNSGTTDLSTGWRTSETIVTLPANSLVRRFYITLMAASEGSTWFDDVRLVTLHNEAYPTYASWANTYADGAAPTIINPGYSEANLLRYAFEYDAGGGMPSFVLSTPNAQNERFMEVTLRRKSYAPELTYKVQASTELASWQTIQQLKAEHPETITVRDTIPSNLPARRFIRVMVEKSQ
jgi:hypothetical protein